jgi:TetR/AcrR family transcriptional regulator, repressor for uid operon
MFIHCDEHHFKKEGDRMPLRDDYAEARTTEILEAAERVFIRKGFVAATMQEVATEAGISAGNIYRYFTSKEDLIRAACDRGSFQYGGFFEAAAAAGDSPWLQLMAVGDQVWSLLRAEGARDESMLILESTLAGARDEQVGETLASFLQSIREALAGLIAEGQRRGEVTSQVDAEALATLLMAIVGGVRLLEIQLNQPLDSESLQRLTMQLLGAIAPGRSGPQAPGEGQ